MRNVIFCSVFHIYLLSLCYLSEQAEIDEPEPFRMRKVNLVWDKARRLSLTNAELNELYVELQVHDKNEAKLKKQRAEGLDENGEIEAVVRKNLDRILSKYGLVQQNTGQSTLSDQENKIPKLEDEIKRDQRLDKLWSAAIEEENFSKEELQQLRRELDHHNEKWKQYKTLVNLVGDHEPNSIHKTSKHDQETLNKLKEEMNMKQHEIDGNYQRLKRKVLLAASDMSDFQDQRVLDLWKKAMQEIKSPEELEIMKEELMHFDNKIAKHNDLREQLDVAEDLLNQGHDHIKPKHDKISAKLKQHRKYIKKLHATLSDKVASHNEL